LDLPALVGRMIPSWAKGGPRPVARIAPRSLPHHMASNPHAEPPPPARQLHVVAGLLSYLVPGLGQIVQGRYAKGILFFVCIYTLFIYGTIIGSGSVTVYGRHHTLNTNVYLPSDPNANARSNPLVTRWPFLGQFWVGVAAWPAIIQYFNYNA